MDILTRIADAMQGVLSEIADTIAIETGFVKRQRKVTGSRFAQTLVFGWLDNPDATLDELTQTGVDIGLEISPQGLDQRFTQQGADCLHRILEEAIEVVITADPVAIPLFQRFKGVYLQDASTIVLPDALGDMYPGCGGSSSENTSASVKLHPRWDLTTGKLSGLCLQSGREHERNSSLQPESLPPGSLWIVDLGYFSLKDYADLDAQGKYWLSRVNSQCHLYDDNGKLWDLVDFLEEHCHSEMDVHVLLGAKERLPCRLLAVRVPKKIAAVRHARLKAEARRKGRKVSKRALKLANWTVLCTKIPPELLSLSEAFVLMRARWQIELLFKLWKDQCHVDEWRSEKPWRILCEVYAKLIGLIIQNWLLLSGSWHRPERSLWKGAKTIRKHSTYLAIAFASGCRQRLHEALRVIQRCLSLGSGISKRKTKPSTYQLLLELTGDS